VAREVVVRCAWAWACRSPRDEMGAAVADVVLLLLLTMRGMMVKRKRKGKDCDGRSMEEAGGGRYVALLALLCMFVWVCVGIDRCISV
jgi:hypothetical protein